jgi:DNA-binding NarL/FixJ family response regulator
MLFSRESFIIAILLSVVVVSAYDIYIDLAEGTAVWHLLQEVFIVLLSTGAIAWFAFGQLRQQQEIARLQQEINATHHRPAVPDERAQHTRHQLGQAIHAQFVLWQLTGSEQEVALLLLKGLSFKEIAAVRSTLEKTVRQQASAIYKKAGVSGRHAFAAWFIEDFL